MRKISKKLSIVGLVAVFIIVMIILFIRLDLDLTSLTLKKVLPEGRIYGVSREQAVKANNLEVIFFDVGQGDAILINTPENKQILIDGGPDNMILDKLAEYLAWNDKSIDVVVLTHPHADHVTGLVQVLERFNIDEVWITGVVYASSAYLEFLNLIKEKNIPAKIIFACGQGKQKVAIISEEQKEKIECEDEINFENNIKITFLWPLENLSGKNSDNLNNSSIVFRLDYNDSSLLFTGDIEEEAENGIIGTANVLTGYLQADILKVPHHGSSSSFHQALLDLISPKYAVISVGQDNPFGHPSLRTLRRLERMNINILRTDKHGDIVFESNGVDLLKR